jgi:hypothetical protein
MVRFQVLTVANMKMTVFWDIAPCSVLEVYHPDNGGSKHLWNISKLLPDYITSQKTQITYMTEIHTVVLKMIHTERTQTMKMIKALKVLAVVKMSMLVFCVVMTCRLVGQHWRWRQYVPPKHWYLPTSPHSVSTQKTDTFNA